MTFLTMFLQQRLLLLFLVLVRTSLHVVAEISTCLRLCAMSPRFSPSTFSLLFSRDLWFLTLNVALWNSRLPIVQGHIPDTYSI